MYEQTEIESSDNIYEVEVRKFEKKFGYIPRMDEFLDWYLGSDFRIGDKYE